jgi:hypothetical protein
MAGGGEGGEGEVKEYCPRCAFGARGNTERGEGVEVGPLREGGLGLLGDSMLGASLGTQACAALPRLTGWTPLLLLPLLLLLD